MHGSVVGAWHCGGGVALHLGYGSVVGVWHCDGYVALWWGRGTAVGAWFCGGFMVGPTTTYFAVVIIIVTYHFDRYECLRLLLSKVL